MAIKIENVVTPSAEQWEAIIRGTRNPMNSWDKSDSVKGEPDLFENCRDCTLDEFFVGNNDLDLMKRLVKAGPEHAKYRRMIVVYADVTAPRYWWAEYDTYKVGTVANSCSTMHKIADKNFTTEDFSTEHLVGKSFAALKNTLDVMNLEREHYLATKDKDCWWQMIQLLPQSYNQKRTIMLNYEVLANIYRQRLNHKLDEWREFSSWIEQLPYSELITAKEA